MSKVFAIVCDVCNEPMGYYVEDTGMARCEKCQQEHYLAELERMGTWPDDPKRICEEKGHDWGGWRWGGFETCKRCGKLNLR